MDIENSLKIKKYKIKNLHDIINIMLDFHQKRKVRAVLYHRATLIFLSIFVLIAIHSTWAVYQKKTTSEEMKNIALKRTEELRLRDEELKSRIDRLETTIGVEEEIRSKFTVAKGGESMVIVVEDPDSKDGTADQDRGLWQKILDFFSR